jgi:hypothetical protein
MASPTELARESLNKTEILQKVVELLKERLDKLDKLQLYERLAVVERRLADLEKAVEELKPTKAEHEEMGAVKNRLTQLEDQKKLGDTRAFQFIVLFIGGLLTLAINIALLFLKK